MPDNTDDTDHPAQPPASKPPPPPPLSDGGDRRVTISNISPAALRALLIVQQNIRLIRQKRDNLQSTTNVASSAQVPESAGERPSVLSIASTAVDVRALPSAESNLKPALKRIPAQKSLSRKNPGSRPEAAVSSTSVSATESRDGGATVPSLAGQSLSPRQPQQQHAQSFARGSQEGQPATAASSPPTPTPSPDPGLMEGVTASKLAPKTSTDEASGASRSLKSSDVVSPALKQIPIESEAVQRQGEPPMTPAPLSPAPVPRSTSETGAVADSRGPLACLSGERRASAPVRFPLSVLSVLSDESHINEPHADIQPSKVEEDVSLGVLNDSGSSQAPVSESSGTAAIPENNHPDVSRKRGLDDGSGAVLHGGSEKRLCTTSPQQSPTLPTREPLSTHPPRAPPVFQYIPVCPRPLQTTSNPPPPSTPHYTYSPPQPFRNLPLPVAPQNTRMPFVPPHVASQYPPLRNPQPPSAAPPPHQAPFPRKE
ncbi:hypothetical protein HDU96_010366 [Phlyctochytrium bullatum]|nr:hypothetical protein HDU96_010366 [Phlyctochytrium bullatum]